MKISFFFYIYVQNLVDDRVRLVVSRQVVCVPIAVESLRNDISSSILFLEKIFFTQIGTKSEKLHNFLSNFSHCFILQKYIKS